MSEVITLQSEIASDLHDLDSGLPLTAAYARARLVRGARDGRYERRTVVDALFSRSVAQPVNSVIYAETGKGLQEIAAVLPSVDVAARSRFLLRRAYMGMYGSAIAYWRAQHEGSELDYERDHSNPFARVDGDLSAEDRYGQLREEWK